MNRLVDYLNPFARIGKRSYSFVFPFFFTLLVVVVIELVGYVILKDPDRTSIYAIIATIAAIIYCSFRDGLKGGLTATVGTLLYYFHIIYTRSYQGERLESALIMVALLSSINFSVAMVIGWLRQTIDKLIEREINEKQRLEAVIQQIPAGVIIADKEGNIVQSNERFNKIFNNKGRLDIKVGKVTAPNATYKGKPVKPKQWPLAQALFNGRQVLGKEYIFRKKRVNQAIQISAAPIKGRDGNILAAVCIMTDVTAQRELERQKDEFIGIASHELKTPVTSIKAYTQVLKHNFSKSGDKDSVNQLEKMDAQLNKLTDLIGDLLDVTKIESGQIQFNESLFDFDKVVKEQVSQMQLTTQRHTLSLRCNTNAKIYGDSERVGQVLTNLISNAIKYSPHAKKIIIEGKRVKNNVELSVRDFGIGMSKSNSGKVFERFYRISGPNNQTFPGLGLGLYISSEIIKRMGGKIWVESEEGKGSTFFFSLPIKDNNKKKA